MRKDTQTIESVCADANFSKWLKSMMKQKTIKAETLAGVLGYERKTITAWLNGYRSPRIETVAKICHYFGQEYILISLKPNSDLTAMSGPIPKIFDRRADA